MKKKTLTIIFGLAFTMILGFAVFTGCNKKETSVATETTTQQNNNEGVKGTVDYPKKPIELVLPVNAGGDTDVNGRIFAKYLSDELGQQVVIVNMGGAGGSVGTQAVMDSPADGYKALWYHNSTILNTITGVSEIEYTDLAVASIPLIDKTAILVARADSGWKNLEDMISYAKESPGKITVGMETATLAHLVPLTIQDKMDVEFNIVDIGAASARLTGLLGGQIDMYFVQYGAVKDYISTGEFVALCALSEERNPAYPDVPTAAELGCDISFDKFFYFAFPAGTPEEVIDTFNKAVENVVENPKLQAEFDALYLSPQFTGTEDSLDVIKNTETFYLEYKDLLK